MKERKPFLPSPRYKPLRNAVFAFLVGVASFGLIMLGVYLNGIFSILSIIGAVIFIAAFLFALFSWFQGIWVMFIKGGWKEEHKEYIETIKPKQPWER